MSKTRLLLLLFLMAVLCVPVIAPAQTRTVSIDNISGYPGASLVIPINIDDAADIALARIKVTYDAAVIDCNAFDIAAPGDLLPTDDILGNQIQIWQLISVTTAVDKTEIIVFTTKLDAILSGGSGSLVKLACSVTGFPEENTSLDFEIADIRDIDNNRIPVSTIFGIFTVNFFCNDPGDIDHDCDVDRDDLNIILATTDTSAIGPDDPRDIDGDGMITLLDANELILLCTNPMCR
jgi:hypothetical protein